MEYTYLLVDNSLYINLEMNLFKLMYFLFFLAKPFKFLERKTNSKILSFFKPILRFKRVLEFTYLFYRRKQIYNRSKEPFPIINLKFYGHCLFVLREGEYKIINFKKKVVTTVFPNSFSGQDIEENISKLIEAQNCNLTPKIIGWNLKKRYIKECYLNLKTPSIYSGNLNNYYLIIFPIIRNIALSTNPQVIGTKQYIQNLVKCIDKLIDFYLNKNPNTYCYDNIILEIFLLTKEKLQTCSSKEEIFLVLSHGDLAEGNILKSRKKSYVIDWTTIDIRSCYFDFYYILFDKAIVTKEAGNESINFFTEINTAFYFFQLHLIQNIHLYSTFTTDILDQPDTYRYLFYLEFILLRLQEYPKTDQEHIIWWEKWINFFKLYENKKKKETSNTLKNLHS